MGLLDSVLGSLSGGSQGGQTPGSQTTLLLIEQVGATLLSNSAANGGLAGLVQQFQNGGLGHIINSWVGTGQNLPISTAQLQQVLGNEKLAALAKSVGLQPADVATHLTQLLPHLVDHLTPQGQVPTTGVAQTDIASAISGLAAKFLNR